MLDTLGGWIFAIALFCGLISLGSLIDANTKKNVDAYSKIHNCHHIGYAGNQNTNKMYRCNNGIKLDREMYL